MLKLKIGNKAAQAHAQAVQSGQSSVASANGQQAPATPAPASSSTPTPGGGFKLKLNVSQPPTPIEQPGSSLFAASTVSAAATDKKKRPYQRKSTDGQAKGKKRAAEEDASGPALKRIASGPTRKISLKLPQTPSADGPSNITKISLAKRKQSLPKILNISTRGKIPPRPKGVGYDSEDSDTEKDPAVQQAFVLRMEDNEDAAYLRNAIAEGKIGPHPSQGDAEVSLKFLEKNYRRAIVKVRSRMYGAVLVDLPCIIESMKSHDRKGGWWKVADIAQMLLVLGRCDTEEQAKSMPLPREVNKDNYQYAHGLTPPMHWVRKRRFRRRLNYNEAMNVEEEVKRLLEADREWEQSGGQVTSARGGIEQQAEPAERQGSEYQFEFGDDDAEGEDAVETVEREGQQPVDEYEEEDEDDDDIEAQMQAVFEEEDQQGGPMQDLVQESPGPIADQAPSLAAVENALQQQQQAAEETDATPVGTPLAETTEQSEEESDEDEDDEDSPDVVDDDAAAKAMERAQQLEEITDLEREIEKVRQKMTVTANQLLAQREKKKLIGLEEELAVKKQVMGFDDEE